MLPVKIITFPSRVVSYSNNACGEIWIVKSERITKRPNTNLPPLLSCGMKKPPFWVFHFQLDCDTIVVLIKTTLYI